MSRRNFRYAIGHKLTCVLHDLLCSRERQIGFDAMFPEEMFHMVSQDFVVVFVKTCCNLQFQRITLESQIFEPTARLLCYVMNLFRKVPVQTRHPPWKHSQSCVFLAKLKYILVYRTHYRVWNHGTVGKRYAWFQMADLLLGLSRCDSFSDKSAHRYPCSERCEFPTSFCIFPCAAQHALLQW